ncbi:MAG: hypothetical protein K2H03_06175, partial [Muribaculaceae bacterium]|nr:hypothetical protein [Muribaculaceae bacterium]
LLGGTSEEWTETAATLKVPIVGDIAEGETVTLSLDLEPGADVKSFLIYNSGWKGSQDCGHMIPVDGKAQMTWQWKYPTQGDVNVELWLQPRPDGTTGVNRLRCIKLERGPVATPWCRAESELALRSELDELRAVDIELSALDTMGRSDWGLVTALQIANGKIASRRYYGVCSDGKPVGTLEFFSDDQSHVLIQRLTTLATPNSDGSGFYGHNHNEMRCYWRRYNILASISGVDKGTWSKWEEQEPKGLREELNRLQMRSSAGRVMSVAGLMSHPEQNVLDSKLVVNGVVDVWLSEDDYFVFGVSTVNPSNGMGATMMVTYFEGAEAFGTRQGNAVYPTVDCVLIDRSNGKMYCMGNGSLKTISG